MDSYGLYEDLSLFNGDLLVGFPLLADEEPPVPSVVKVEDGPFSIIEAPIKPSAEVVLGHPQQGSGEMGLVDLLASQPSQDLSNPLESAWMDTKMDILDLLTGDDQSTIMSQEQHRVVEAHPMQVSLTMPPSPEAAVVPSNSVPQSPTSVDIESFDVLQQLLFTDMATSDLNSGGGQEEILQPPQQFQDTDDMLEDLVDSSLEDLLSSELDASVLDNPVLSPVSTDDIESLLPSSPPSPNNGLTSFIDTLSTSMTSEPDSAYASLNASYVSDEGVSFDYSQQHDTASAMHPTSSKTRSAPYQKSGGRKAKNPDRKERKKEQNRSAALRYRQKKRNEGETVQEECDRLSERNTELKDKVDSIGREIQYLKDLLADVYKAKGLVLKKHKIIKRK